MIHKMKRIVACLLLSAVLVGCAPAQTPTEPTEAPTQPVPTVTDPTVTAPAETEAPVTEPTVTEATVTEAPVTEPSITEPSIPEPTVTEPTVTVPVPTDPAPTETKPTQTETTEAPATEPADPDAGLIDIDTDPLPCGNHILFERLFDPDRKIQVDIRISDGELAKLQADYDHYSSFGSKSPIYRMADVVITIDGVGYLIREVGVRMKGNTSRIDFYSDDRGIYNAIHLKLDFQQTFDDEDHYGSDAKVWSDKDLRKARKNRNFATLEELELRWDKSNDYSHIRESYAHELYTSEGILTPRINLCSLDLGGVHMGVYTVNEPVDKVFLAKRLPIEDLGGDLYKCSRKSSFTPTASIGVEDEDQGLFYAYDLKTNKKTSDHSSLKNLITALRDPAMTRETFGELVDVEYFLSYAAVSWFLGDPDDLRYNYNNFYLYFLKSSGKAIIIPYDLDLCLGLNHGATMASQDPFTDLAMVTKDPQPQENPLFLHTVVRDSLFVADYADALDRVSQNDLLDISTFRRWFRRAKGLYEDDVAPGKALDNMSGRKPTFDMDRASGSRLNMEDFLTGIMETYRHYMSQFRDENK